MFLYAYVVQNNRWFTYPDSHIIFNLSLKGCANSYLLFLIIEVTFFLLRFIWCKSNGPMKACQIRITKT